MHKIWAPLQVFWIRISKGDILESVFLMSPQSLFFKTALFYFVFFTREDLSSPISDQTHASYSGSAES